VASDLETHKLKILGCVRGKGYSKTDQIVSCWERAFLSHKAYNSKGGCVNL
jgi:hypothetical protein